MFVSVPERLHYNSILPSDTNWKLSVSENTHHSTGRWGNDKWCWEYIHNCSVRTPQAKSYASMIVITNWSNEKWMHTVYPKKYAHDFVVLCFVVVMQSFIMKSHKVFIHIHQGCFAGTGTIVRLPQCQWSKPDGYGKISQCITITKHSKAKTVCIFLGIYCMPAEWLLPMHYGVYGVLLMHILLISCNMTSSHPEMKPDVEDTL